jgi:hypothetical protein
MRSAIEKNHTSVDVKTDREREGSSSSGGPSKNAIAIAQVIHHGDFNEGVSCGTDQIVISGIHFKVFANALEESTMIIVCDLKTGK